MRNKLSLLLLVCVVCVSAQAQSSRQYERGEVTFKTDKIKDANGEVSHVRIGAYVGNDIVKEETYELMPPLSVKMAEHIGTVSEEDINFDGYPDVDIYLGYMGAFANNTQHEGWLWDQSSHRFVEAEGYAGIGEPMCDHERKYISTVLSAGPEHRVTSYYRWQGNELQLYFHYVWPIQGDDDDYVSHEGLLNYPCYRIDAKLDGRISVNIVFQKDEKGNVGGYIYYPRARRPAPILVKGTVSKRGGTDHYSLKEYQPDGSITGEISLSIKSDEYYYGGTISGEWTNPQTKKSMKLDSLVFSREMPNWFTDSVL